MWRRVLCFKIRFQRCSVLERHHRLHKTDQWWSGTRKQAPGNSRCEWWGIAKYCLRHAGCLTSAVECRYLPTDLQVLRGQSFLKKGLTCCTLDITTTAAWKNVFGKQRIYPGTRRHFGCYVQSLEIFVLWFDYTTVHVA